MPIHGYPGGVITANPVAPTSTVATGVWTTEQQLQAVSQGNWPLPGPPQPISRSLRFNSADSAYLNRTPASTGNQKTWTWSSWIKRSTLGALQNIFNPVTGGDGANENQFKFNADDTIQVYDSGATRGNFITTQVFRDVSAWYHIVVALDTTQATSTNRFKLYVNGVQVTAFSTASYPSQNTDWGWNRTVRHDIGRYAFGATQYFNGYMAEINFIDGQALTPSSFGQTNASTGVWEPINYTGTYGTNGFYLNFSDNSGTTSTTLGKDSSGNGNNWTPNNFSVTAGAGNDSLVDSPTSYGTDTGVGGEVRGNYCTINPLENPNSFTLTNGNLDMGGSNAWRGTRATMGVSSGKWYWEYVRTSATSGGGPGLSNATYTWAQMSTSDPGTYAGGYVYIYNGQKGNNNSYVAYGASFGQNDVIGVAFDADNGTLTFYKNGASQGTAYTGITSGPYFPTDSGPFGGCTYNFGQRAFAYTAPSGFKALCTQNLPTPTIGATSTTQANDYMNVVLYTGDGANPRTVSGVGFQPDFVWTKSRSSAFDHWLFDAVRGATKTLTANSTSAEITYVNSLKSFISDGFTVGDLSDINANGGSYVAWNWKANGAGSSNTAGTITSTVSANTTSGFSIVTYTGTGSNATVGHGLGVAPSMIFVKYRNVLTSNDWNVYHSSVGATGRLFLNLTSGTQTTALAWNNTAPTSTVFSIGTGSDVNNSATNYVAYCFAAVAGYSAFGSYTGNGSTDGPFVYLGFRPEFIMTKSTSNLREWYMYDAARDTYNVSANYLRANTSSAEGSFTSYDMVSNGFKLRSSDTAFNGSGETYIYMAFAEFPFKYSLAR